MRKNVWNFIKRSTVALLMLNRLNRFLLPLTFNLSFGLKINPREGISPLSFNTKHPYREE